MYTKFFAHRVRKTGGRCRHEKAEVIAEGSDVTRIGLGSMFEMAETTKKLLEAQGLSVALINPRWIKPLDTAVLETFAKKTKATCTFEDHVLHNGFGRGVMDAGAGDGFNLIHQTQPPHGLEIHSVLTFQDFEIEARNVVANNAARLFEQAGEFKNVLLQENPQSVT